MGNSPVFSYRLPALAAAVLATCAISLAVVSGGTCSFVQIEGKQGHVLTLPPGTNVAHQISSTSIGVLCDGGVFDRQGDKLWTVSFTFFLVAVTLGSCATALSWAVSIILPPTDTNWSWLSIVAAIAAIMQVPVFALIDVKPCNLNGNECKPILGFFLMIASTVLWIGVTLITQCLDPPLWAQELNAWRVHKPPERSPRPSKRDRGVLLTDNEYDDDLDDLTPNQPPSAAIFKPLTITDGIFKWARRRRWATSEQNTTQKLRGREPDVLIQGVDLAEMGSYYANSCNSRLLLKVLPNGKIPGDDQKSMASFGDLDSFVNLAEAERMELGPEPQLLSPPSEDVTSCTMQSSTVDDSVPSEESPPVAPDSEKLLPAASASSDLPHDGEHNAEQAGSDDEELENNRTDRELLFESGFQDDSPRKKLAAGIRALTEKMKLDSMRRRRDSTAYFLIDDNDISKSFPLPPIEVTITTFTPIGKDMTLITPSTGTTSPNNQSALRKVFACVAGANQHYSSSEEEPEPIYFSGDEAAAEGMSSMGRHLESGDDADGDETSTLSTSSDSEADLAEEIAEFIPRHRTLRPRRRAKLRSSSLCSLKSRGSLLEMTIDEETDLELRAFESSDEEKHLSDKRTDPYPLVRTLSETDAIDMRRRSKSDFESSNSDSFSTSAIEGCLRHVNRFSRSPYLSQMLMMGSVSKVVPISDDTSEVVPNESVHSEVQITSSFETSSERNKLEGYIPSADEDDRVVVSMQRKRGRSLSLPRRTNRLPSPSPSDISDDVRLMSWKDERIFKAGIHAGPVIVSDESSSEGQSRKSDNSGLSNLSQRARLARVQRLQREATRRRARTLDPPTNRHRTSSPGTYSFLIDSLDTLDLHLAQVSRPEGVEYGPDEISL